MNIISVSKKMVKSNPKFGAVISPIYNALSFNKKRISGVNNRIKGINRSFVSTTKIKIVGNNNIIEFGDSCYLKDCSFFIKGDNNHIILGDNFYGIKTEFWVQDEGNLIEVGENTAIGGSTQLAATEGKTIKIGKRSLFASDISVRTGDSHSIFQDGLRINPAEDVYIGDNVWVATKTTLLKGTLISNNSIVGTGALVTKKFNEPNVLIVGSPAKVVKENVEWINERV